VSAEDQPLLSADEVIAALRAGALDGLRGVEIRQILAKLDPVISVCPSCRCLVEFPSGTRIVETGLCGFCSQSQGEP
jgi:hypothetical protein